MSPDIAYFLKVNIALALFYAFYRLFFHKDTFFQLRRLLLLLCFGLAFVYPLPNIQEWVKEQEPISGLILMYSTLLPEVEVQSEAAAATQGQTIFRLIALACYWAGVAWFSLRFLMQSGRILWLALKSRPMLIGDTKVCVSDKISGPFSFFRLIFLPPDPYPGKETDEILTHERTHVSQWHSIDVLISEWMCIICWMNPFAWLLRREQRYNLEYLADNKVLASGFDSRAYQYHLLGLTYHHHQAAANLYNNFNVLHLKNRICMMNKKRSRAIARTKYLMFLPLAALLMLLANVEAVARISRSAPEPVADAAGEKEAVVQPEAPQDDKKPVFTVVEQMPRFPGGEGELLKFVATNVKYPEEAKAKKIEGRVIVSFIVNDDGRVSDPVITRGIEPLLDAESLRVIQLMPVWTPGKQRGIPVAVRYTLPITFKLQ
ncbi:MAG: M56 family metallopeptidase [Tannerellaceae bacterium]|jgi:TonB family protein|nr:M56 family metallopeptidase [Tannerellaceae bacterium]